jgi:hypothetical protein
MKIEKKKNRYILTKKHRFPSIFGRFRPFFRHFTTKTRQKQPKNASETGETGDFFAKNAEIGAFSANFRAEFDEIATENAISGLAFGKMWHAAHKIGLLGLENGRFCGIFEDF